MANFKAKCPMIAELTEDGNGGYTLANGMIIGKLMSVSINPTKVEAELFGDDGRAEDLTEYTGADVTLNTTYLPLAARPIMFGETYTPATTGETATPAKIVSKGGDDGKLVAYGCVKTEIQDHVKKYVALTLLKVKFSLPDEQIDTKGDSITFNTPSVPGKASTIDGSENAWREYEYYDTEAAAIAALKTKFGIGG